MNIIYLQKRQSDKCVSNDIIYEFEQTIINDTKFLKNSRNWIEKIAFIFSIKFQSIFKLFSREKINQTFSMLMGTGDFYSFIYEYKKHQSNCAYLFDAWFQDHHEIELFCKLANFQYIFCSSSIATQKLNQSINNTKFIWIPEAINISNYTFLDYKEKTIDVLQFGRKYEDIQQKLSLFLEKESITYLYEKEKGDIVFKTREDFINGLAATKISLCFPRSCTHPNLAEGQETMTIRYLQSMASKTLVVGKCPEEMKKLFSYNPIIELDLTNPGEHIKKILDNYSDYIPLIERNYYEVLNNHQWKNRWETMKSIMYTSYK